MDLTIEDLPHGDDFLDEESLDTLPVLPPARREPTRTEFQSSDPTLRTCVHEIARALEQLVTKEYVPLFQSTAEFETAAVRLAEMLHAEKCPLRG